MTDLDRARTRAEEEAGNSGQERSLWRRSLGFLVTLFICFVLVFLITQFVLQHNTVIGSSMAPTLEDSDEVFVEKISRLFASGLKRGDIVTADAYQGSGEEDDIIIIKRVVGLPGEHITVREGYVWINGGKLDEPYLSEEVLTSEHNMAFSDLILGPDEYYLLGDNRMSSRDSRDIGPVARQEIEGRLILRFYPLDKIGKPK
jgi:signal peptidase I